MLSFRLRRLQVRHSAALADSSGVHRRVFRPFAGPDSAVGVVDSARTGAALPIVPDALVARRGIVNRPPGTVPGPSPS